ncbi:hypothetical protein ACFV4T_40745, partial [Streptomyces sp. NPDC059755]|uniref:PspA-associated protein PspAB n=1 Tax=Streptomyces sp. NPDC059755 TaxID=3346934 RepID=UPI003663E0D2
MGLLDILLGRTKPVVPDLDQLFALPSAAVTLEAAAGFTPTGQGAVCFATVEGSAFEQTHREVQALLDADTERTGPPVRLVRDDYGYSWLLSQRSPDQLPLLVNDLHAVNSAMEVNGFGPQLLCSLAGFEDRRDGTEEAGREEAGGRRLALVYLYKRGSFYPFAPGGAAAPRPGRPPPGAGGGGAPPPRATPATAPQ